MFLKKNVFRVFKGHGRAARNPTAPPQTAMASALGKHNTSDDCGESGNLGVQRAPKKSGKTCVREASWVGGHWMALSILFFSMRGSLLFSQVYMSVLQGGNELLFTSAGSELRIDLQTFYCWGLIIVSLVWESAREIRGG